MVVENFLETFSFGVVLNIHSKLNLTVNLAPRHSKLPFPIASQHGLRADSLSHQ